MQNFISTILINNIKERPRVINEDPDPEPGTDFSPAFNVGDHPWASRFLTNTQHSFVNTDLLWSPAFFFDVVTKKALAMISRDPQAPPYGQVIGLSYDSLRGLDEHYTIGQPLEDIDTHQYPSGRPTDAGVWKVVQEHEHTTPIDVYSSSDLTKWTKQAALYGTAIAYNNLYRNADGTFTSLCRGTGTKIYCAHVIHGDANFENWGSQIQISETNVGQTYRHYVQMPKRETANGMHGFFIVPRRAANEIYVKCCYIETPSSGADSWKKFYNAWGTQMFDIVAAGRYFTEAEMLTRFLMWEGDDDNSQIHYPAACRDTDGRLYSIQSKNGTSNQYYFIYNDGTQWVDKLITGITGITDRGNIQAGAFQHLIVYAANDIRAYVMRDTGVVNIFHTWEIKTTDLGTTWTLVRDMTPDFTSSEYAYMHLPQNVLDIPANTNFPILIQTNSGTLKVKPCAFGEVQAYNPPVITPSANMAHASGLGDWAVSNRQVSGSNITSITDAFGLRNMAAVNNPQYDSGEDAVLTNGTNNYLNLATTGLTTLEAMTFIAVVKVSVSAILLSFTNNTSNSRYLDFIITGGAVQYQLSNSSSPPSTTCTGNKRLVNDGQYHIVAYVVKGGGFGVDLYVDGMKQPEINNAAANIAVWNALGRGSNAVTSINAIRIASKDVSGTDLFYGYRWKRKTLYSSALSRPDLEARFKFLSNLYSIPLVTHFE